MSSERVNATAWQQGHTCISGYSSAVRDVSAGASSVWCLSGYERQRDVSELQVVAVISGMPSAAAIVREAMQRLVTATRAEDGCLRYELYESAAAPGTFITWESWRSQDDLDAHLQSTHVAAALAAAGEQLTAAPAIHPLQPVPEVTAG